MGDDGTPESIELSPKKLWCVRIWLRSRCKEECRKSEDMKGRPFNRMTIIVGYIIGE